MRLCDRDIEYLLYKKKIKIIPLPSVKRIHGLTVDLKLGNKFRVFCGYPAAYIDLSKSKSEIEKTLTLVMSNEILLNHNESFFIHPGELILAITLEKIILPNNIVGWLDGRSSLARLGLMIHVTAHRIDPGWKGNIVLECYNYGKLPLALRPGMLIGALSFELLSGPSLRPYNDRKNAKYQNQDRVLGSIIKQD